MSAQQEYDLKVLMGVLDDLKYTTRLNMLSFTELLFPDAMPYYYMQKWEMFRDNPLGFFWSLDSERLLKIVSYIASERGTL